MTVRFSSVLAARAHSKGDLFSVHSVDVLSLGDQSSPIALLDRFRVRGNPFGSHPHAGFSAVAYVLETSPGAVRSRDSLGNDGVTEPGGLVWTEAGSGIVHEDFPASEGCELHGIQIFVNVSSKNKFVPPRVLRLSRKEVPEWTVEDGNRVRILVGAYDAVSSPLVPIEPFTLLDIELRREMGLPVLNGHNAIVYVVEGEVMLRSEHREQTVPANHALALRGDGGTVALQAVTTTRLLVASGEEIREPMVVEGNAFIMNDRAQVEAAAARFSAGQMGFLAPLPRG